MTFDYLLDKLAAADIRSSPFRHVWIEEFFEAEHFAALTAAPEIDVSASSDEAVLDALIEQGFQIIDFPGCVTDRKAYLRWHRDPASQRGLAHTACEGFGMALRLTAPRTALLVELDEFLKGDRFRGVLAEKFGIDLSATHNDSGIQKYLDGYEISPHPDVRRKAATYMVNINPAHASPALQHHTRYLQFTPAYRYVQAYWEGHPEAERCWVPWDWCEVVSEQRGNNSLVAFSPDNDTLHGIKAQYDHRPAQRTQLYGNLWYSENAKLAKPQWEHLVIQDGRRPPAPGARRSLTSRLVREINKAIKPRGTSDPAVNANRFKLGKR